MNLHRRTPPGRRLGGDGWRSRPGNVAYVTDPHKWVIHGERLVDDTPHIRVSLADVGLPNRVRFTQYVFRMRRCAMGAITIIGVQHALLRRAVARVPPL
jgi:hypothetical protein